MTKLFDDEPNDEEIFLEEDDEEFPEVDDDEITDEEIDLLANDLMQDEEI